MAEPIRVLLIDDDEDDYVLTRDLLAEGQGGRFHLDWAGSYEKGLEALLHCHHEAYLLDYRLGTRTGLELLREPAAATCDAPIILLTGQGDREVDLEAMKAGAADYLTKGDLNPITLERTIRHAVERHRDREAIHRLNADLETKVEERTRELEKANAALQEAGRRKDEFLAMLAHELRNPLAPIRNGLDILGMVGLDSDTFRQTRDMMERQLGQMVRLIDDLLDLSRISRGKVELRQEQVELAAVVNQAVEASRPLIETAGHELTVTLPPGPVQLEADPARLAQILGNLLNNAAKYTPPGGKIGLTAEVVPGGPEPLTTIRVRDTGLGIPAEKLPHIFDMFVQASRSPDGGEGGLGIGLTLVKSLVEMHGGSVQATSDGPGQGSEFVVRLPVTSETGPRQPSREGKGPRAKARPRRVLVVDDNRDAAKTLGVLLRLTGHDVRVAHDGPAALETAQGFQLEVALLDIGLPGMDGHELARRLRGQPGGEKVLLVALTGYGQDDDRRRSQEAGFDAHLVKPVDLEAVYALLAE